MTSHAKNAHAPFHLSIFHTNDMHAHLEAIARLSTYARRLRKAAQGEGRTVYFWDAGDAADRRIQICSATKCAAFSPILNAMGYDLQTMGNAIALTYGPQAMADVGARAEFPILAANCRDLDGPVVEGLKETVLIPLPSGLRMGVIGLTPPYGNVYEVFGLRFPDTHELTRRLVSELKAAGASLVLLLSHLGLEEDRTLADEVGGIDVIIGGHSHSRLLEGEMRNGVLIAQAGHYAEAVGRVDLNINPQSREIIAHRAVILDVPDDTPSDQAVLEAISAAEGEVAELMAQPIGELLTPLDHDFFGECGVGDLAADALRGRMGAEIAISTGGMFHHALQAGTMTFGDLNKTCFSTANPWLSEVRGSQILEALERGLDPSITQFMHGAYRGAPVGVPQISGMAVEFDKDAEKGHRIGRVTIMGEALEPDRLYRVAHTDAEAMDEVGYLELDEGQTIEKEVPTILPEVIADYVRQYSPLSAPQHGRWIPVSPP